jgi:putative transposase
MARLPRLVVPGFPHLLIQRSRRGQPLFGDDVDRDAYRQLLRDLAPARGVAIHAYALLPEAVHLLATPAKAADLGVFVQAVGRHYVRAFNRRHRREGGLWEGRFRSSVLEPERWLLPSMQFIESQPVRAGLVVDAAHYPWTSFAHHTGASVDAVVSDHSLFWALGNTPFDRQSLYRARFDSPLRESDVQALLNATLHGWALGSPAFIQELEKLTPRRLAPGRPGRPPKTM